MTKTERTRQLKREMIPLKSKLIKLQGQVDREGLAADAESLARIIARLEDWGNR